MTSVKNNNMLPPGLVSNLQQVLLSRKGGGGEEEEKKEIDPSNDGNDKSAEPSTSTCVENTEEDSNNSKPIVLVTNGDGIDSPGLVSLVEALVREGLYNVHVCAPQSDKSVSSHSVTLQEAIAVTSVEINGAIAYEVSGTPVDCVSLALSGALFSWSKPLLVISGINRGSNCGHHMIYSGVVAGAREALFRGVPSLSISLNWKKEESQESDFKDAVAVCLPVINAAIRDIEKGVFPKSCSLNIEIPTSPSANKGFKLTKRSMWRSSPSWQAVSANRHPSAGHFMSNQQSLGLQLAQLSRDASAAGAARRLTTQRKNMLEIESVGAGGKSDSNRVKKYFRMEFLDKELEDTDEDLDFRAVENGFVAITPLSLSPRIEEHTHIAASDWISSALHGDQ
uniref:Survival protein SurE-like phosphatase/nucleotidase domain-containing protein n=1 Tax=Populus davidiana TaxID=266767 RepID=A0A6M2ECL0_9ROSI